MDVAFSGRGERVTSQILEWDARGNPTVIVYSESPEERAERLSDYAIQEDRARAIANSLRRSPVRERRRERIAR